MTTLSEKYESILASLRPLTSTDPIELAKAAMGNGTVSLHGPEHHFLDGAAFLTALKNAGMPMDYEANLHALAERSLKMPGAMCGYWGVCGSVASIGAVLSILDQTGPLSSDEAYQSHMEFTSSLLLGMSRIGGPRCCKRNAFLALLYGAEYAKKHYGITLDVSHPVVCEFSPINKDCLGPSCPFHPQ